MELVDGIQERDLGALKGQPWHHHAAMTASDPNYDPEREWLWRPAGGESYEDVRQRVMPVLDDLRGRYPAEELVIVSHGAVMRAIWSHLTGAWISSFIPNNCAMLLIPHDGQQFFAPQIVYGDAVASLEQL
jgi:broad specificity phosphatase PhoE